jgi:hypothetical protein
MAGNPRRPYRALPRGRSVAGNGLLGVTVGLLLAACGDTPSEGTQVSGVYESPRAPDAPWRKQKGDSAWDWRLELMEDGTFLLTAGILLEPRDQLTGRGTWRQLDAHALELLFTEGIGVVQHKFDAAGVPSPVPRRVRCSIDGRTIRLQWGEEHPYVPLVRVP